MRALVTGGAGELSLRAKRNNPESTHQQPPRHEADVHRTKLARRVRGFSSDLPGLPRRCAPRNDDAEEIKASKRYSSLRAKRSNPESNHLRPPRHEASVHGTKPASLGGVSNANFPDHSDANTCVRQLHQSTESEAIESSGVAAITVLGFARDFE
jgi:hypothetical protein